MDFANTVIALAAVAIAAMTFVASQRKAKSAAKQSEVDRLRVRLGECEAKVAVLEKAEQECQRERTRLEAARIELLDENRALRQGRAH